MKQGKLLMLPGWSMDSLVWEPVIPFLSEYFQLAFCEWHGIEDVEGYTAKVCGLMEKEEGKLSLMGWSLGSLLAIDAACRYKSKVEKLILVSGTSRFIRDKKTKYLYGWSESSIEKMKTALRADREKVMDSFYSSLFSTEELKNKDYRALFKASMYKNTGSLGELEAGLDYLVQTDFRGLLDDVEAELLIIHGEMDTVCPVQASHYIAERVKSRTVFHVIEGVGHVPFYSAANKFNQIIRAFIGQGDK